MIMPISPIWPAATAVNAEGSIEFHGRTAESLLDEFGSPLYLIDTDEVVARARHFVRAAAEAFNTSTTHVSFAGKAFLSKEVVRLVTEAGMFVDTCTMGEMKIALAAGVPGRRPVLLAPPQRCACSKRIQAAVPPQVRKTAWHRKTPPCIK